MRVAIYARVSTADQNEAMQVEELRQRCQHREWNIASEYVDHGYKGATSRRPELDRLMRDAAKSRFDVVLVYRFDRFARSMRHLVTALDEFRSFGIDFVSLHEGIDTSTPNGRLIFGIFASIAEFEKELIRDRVKSGLASARRRGARLGRPRHGVDPARAVELRKQGMSFPQIARELGIGVGSSYRLLSKNHPLKASVNG